MSLYSESRLGKKDIPINVYFTLLSLKNSLLAAIVLMATTGLVGQNRDWQLTTAYNNLTWAEFVEKTEATYEVQFFFDERSTEGIELKPIISPIALGDYLQQELSVKGISISYGAEGAIFLHASKSIATNLPTTIYVQEQIDDSDTENQAPANQAFLSTAAEYVAQTVVIGTVKEGLNQEKVTLSGYILNAEDESPIIGATCLNQALNIGTASDENGFYTITLSKGPHIFFLNELNHEEKKVSLELRSDGTYNFLLDAKTNLLEEVVVTSDKFNRVKNTKMGFERLTTARIKEIPLVLGEKDILKVATLLAGVQTVGEGASGFNVRGSPADQNLFYIDKVPIYNTSHLFGFFSAFNSEAISEFSLSKSSIPAKFGGRLASVFDITALEGDKEKLKFRGGISPITGNILVEGPIQKEKSSFMLGLRSTYSNWIFNLIKNRDFNSTKVNFADAVMKLSFELNPKNKIQAFGYFSYDKIDFANTTNFDNNNQGSSVSWSHFFNERSNINVSAIYSKLNLQVENKETALDAYSQDNNLEHKEIRADLTLRPFDNHRITGGANAILYDISRGNVNPSGELSLLEPVDLGTERGLELGLYLSDEWEMTERLTLTSGLRYNHYTYLGPQDVLVYPDNLSKRPENVLDTLSFGNNEAIKSYQGLDLRLAARYAINSNFSIKASYNTLHQYIFLLSNTIALAPTDKWKLTDNNIAPMTGHQFAFGVYTNLLNRKLAFSVEPYFKKVQQLVEYRDGADLLINEHPEQDVLQGDLDAYGVEFVLKKPRGRFNGWVNYTYSSASALVNEEETGDFINFGASYPTNYDKPHAFNVVGNYKFSRRFSVSANMVYSTGRPITYPASVYFQNGIQVINFSNRNEYRVPDFFRTDISIKMEGNLKSRKLLHSSFVFSVYNLTGRKNAYSVYFQSNSGRLTGQKVSIFGVPIFSVSYNVKFGNYDN